MNGGEPAVPIGHIRVGAYRIPTDAPESDGTFAWDATTLVVVQFQAGNVHALGYTYADRSTAVLIQDAFAPLIEGRNVFDAAAIRNDCARATRNIGSRGVAAMALAAVDAALWDARAKLLDIALVDVFGAVRANVAIYGSGGFTSYDDAQLCAQLGGWAESGIGRVKMKVGRQPAADAARVATARKAIGADCALFVDANGAYTRAQALALAEDFNAEGVTWFEEPVSSDDREGLAAIRSGVPSGMEIAAGEYGYDAWHFRHLLQAQSVDVLQADVTRCGVHGFLAAASLCEAHGLQLSAHCAPSLHVALGCALGVVRHLEYFHDHARIERLLFDGAPQPIDGVLAADRTRPGFGLEFKSRDAERYAL